MYTIEMTLAQMRELQELAHRSGAHVHQPAPLRAARARSRGAHRRPKR
ncbi:MULTISPECIES: hypothetical protein [Streptomyces]|uniref:Uncharacterized protein n=1 Tax=Streptomyces lycii TaxID=2654337 RepID=A0ABQ7FPW7_9ACTN|nr:MULTISPECIES: hypothetical protein [Streptomyces]KAF4410420.1 hypothetical protein GCU69_03715 [Streptomyces lycii]